MGGMIGVCSPPAEGELDKRMHRLSGGHQDQAFYSERRVTVDRHCLLTPQGKVNEFQAIGRHFCWSASLFPAYVGLSPDFFRSTASAGAFPRVCGVEPTAQPIHKLVYLFSPRMWG